MIVMLLSSTIPRYVQHHAIIIYVVAEWQMVKVVWLKYYVQSVHQYGLESQQGFRQAQQKMAIARLISHLKERNPCYKVAGWLHVVPAWVREAGVTAFTMSTSTSLAAGPRG